MGIDLSFSSAFHPQTNGQTERTNQTLETYLRCFVSADQDDWVSFLPLAEFALNNRASSATLVSPFFCNSGFHPRFSSGQVESSDCPGVDSVVDRLQQIWTQVVDNLTLSQEKAQLFANRRRRVGPRLRVGDLVWLSSRHIPMKVSSPKFKPHFIGPYRISEILNPVSFRLTLPDSFSIHNVFHRSLLRRYVAPMVPSVEPPAPVLVEGELEYIVEKILDSRVSRRKLQYLVKWKGYAQEDNSWVFASDVHAPDLVRAFHVAHPGRPGGSGLRVRGLVLENAGLRVRGSVLEDAGLRVRGSVLEDAGLRVRGLMLEDAGLRGRGSVLEDAGQRVRGSVLEDAGLRVRGSVLEDAGLRVRGSVLEDAGLRVRGLVLEDAGLRVRGSVLEDTGLRVRGSVLEDAGLRVRGSVLEDAGLSVRGSVLEDAGLRLLLVFCLALPLDLSWMVDVEWMIFSELLPALRITSSHPTGSDRTDDRQPGSDSLHIHGDGGGNDDGAGGNDDGAGCNDDGAGGNDDGAGGNDDGAGGNDDDDGAGGNDDGAGCNDDGAGGNDDGGGGNDDGAGGNDDGGCYDLVVRTIMDLVVKSTRNDLMVTDNKGQALGRGNSADRNP
ncbi:unnamed protein product [Ranitomeya imitator]|uniref:Uncharacterized protein n=1 Tax=Ranitomeya imitator TaxID=111125 RepID=A0ABN9MGG5_9NEOB|nr:unnamed protein product [Ranitomeya imitator]